MVLFVRIPANPRVEDLQTLEQRIDRVLHQYQSEEEIQRTSVRVKQKVIIEASISALDQELRMPEPLPGMDLLNRMAYIERILVSEARPENPAPRLVNFFQPSRQFPQKQDLQQNQEQKI